MTQEWQGLYGEAGGDRGRIRANGREPPLDPDLAAGLASHRAELIAPRRLADPAASASPAPYSSG